MFARAAECGVSSDPRLISPASEENHAANIGGDERPASDPPENAGWRHLWLRRAQALLFVTICATFGVLLLILPWSDKWTDNSLLLGHPGLRELISSGFVRGLTSGVGILDLWLGFWEAIHYREAPRGSNHGPG